MDLHSTVSFSTTIQESGGSPLKSDIAIRLSNDPEFSEIPVVKLFSIPILQPPSIQQLESAANQENNDDDDMNSESHSSIPAPPSTTVHPSSLILHYLSNEENLEVIRNYNPPKNNMQYLTFKLGNFKFGFYFLEPIKCIAFLHNGERVISDYWHFMPKETLRYTNPDGNIEITSKVTFENTEVSPNIHLVILFQRILQIESGSAVDRYYDKPGPKTIEAAKKSVIDSYPRISDIYTTFAFTFAKVTSIITGAHGYKFPKAWLCSNTIIRNLDDAIKNTSNRTQIPIQVVMKARPRSAHNIEGYEILHTNFHINIKPDVTFRHQFTFRLDSIQLKKLPEGLKARNIFCVISVQESQITPRLPYLIDPMTKQHVKSLTSTCTYHDKSPVFDDVFTADLPAKLPKNLYIFVYLYHAIVQNESDNDRQFIAHAAFQIVNNGIPVVSGPISAGVSFGMEDKPDKSLNVVNGDFRIFSTIFSGDPNLFGYYEKLKNKEVEEDGLDKVRDDIACRNCITIMANLLEILNDKPFEAVKGLIDMAFHASKVYPEAPQILAGFARYIFHRHDGILKGYETYLNKVGEIVNFLDRRDFVAIPMLFQLATFAGIEEFSETFVSKIASFTDNGLIQTKKFIEEFAFFIRESVPKEKAFSCIEKVTKNFFNTPNKAEILCSFLSIVLDSPLFDAMVFDNKQIEELCVKTIRAKHSRPVQGIFHTILVAASKAEPRRQRFLANKMLNILYILSPLTDIPFAQDNDLQPAIPLFLWILSLAESNSVEEFIKSTNEDIILQSLQFVLNRLKSGVTTKKSEMLSHLEGKYSISSRPKSKSFAVRSKVISTPSMSTFTIDDSKSRDLLLCAQLCSARVVRYGKNYKEIVKIIFHLYTQDFSVNILPILNSVYVKLLADHYNDINIPEAPPYKILSKILEHSDTLQADFGPIEDLTDVLGALATTDINLIVDVQPQKLRYLVNTVKILQEIAYESTDIDESGDALLELANIFKASEEGYYFYLNKLADFWKSKEFVYEEIECRVSMAPYHRKRQELEEIYATARLCMKECLPEYAKQVLKGIDTPECYRILAETFDVDTSSRIYNNFFRVTFSQNGIARDYVYRERGATNVVKLAQRLENQYKDSVVLRDSSIKPEDDGKLYIQCTFIEPFFDGVEKSEFEMHHNVQTFMYETPFTLGNDRQGDIMHQHLLRNIIHTENAMPYLTKRTKIERIDHITLEPIVVSTNMIIDRTKKIRKALDKKDYQSLELQLHGTLLATVNVGPVAIIKEFFNSDDKRVSELKQAFKKFVETTSEGVRKHREWCISEGKSQELCDNLDNGLDALLIAAKDADIKK
ncbi:Dedicator of cytokinesis family protein [Trichomonas vaginalis G3]|uniref:Dedicator of cytokinesis family protein n=1 Tax=Trichomonas vaginalis (strain ATCC PRA-98 / G3) TaxID=412133 RepID=A2F4Y1_TRIV3|nr:memory T cell proliferation [Trichomonas vaginalis G3]EAY00046.1 Dedicator of cytokinesis family protein [Trichomonas vaginalis G3]KAI5483111.1 memory T cell proliferation [Trichomonas vaginalis G3]|eukprot:XP_001312975.1 Dedicator of cytokinesis family protein [Trichomonas vaginalis G3]